MNCEGHVELAMRACCIGCLLVKFEVEGVVGAANNVLAHANLSGVLRHEPTGFRYTTALAASMLPLPGLGLGAGLGRSLG